MKKIFEFIGVLFFSALLVSFLFLFGLILYIVIFVLLDICFDSNILEELGITGYIIVGVITLIIAGFYLDVYRDLKLDKLRKYKKYLIIFLSLITVPFAGWYFHSIQLPSYIESYDIDRNMDSFRIVTIEDQTWMAENLNVSNFRNGDKIFHAKTSKEWVEANENKIAAWCYYENDTLHHQKQGKLYNWHAIIDPRGIAPNGWRIPFHKDWIKLSESLGGDKKSGIHLKDTSWNFSEDDKWGFFSEYKFNATNPVKFSLLPCGAINCDGYFYGMEESRHYFTREKINFGGFSGWWHINENNTEYANIVYLTNGTENLFFDIVNEGEGFYVRCIKD